MNEKSGKIDQHIFDECIQHKCGYHRKEVIAGAQFGVDVSVVDIGPGMAMALTSDPLSLIPSLGLQESAWLSVHLMANDMATTGHAPMYGQFVLNLPSTFSRDEFKIYWEYIHQYCSAIKIAITGGHTGFIEGQQSTIAGGGTFVTIAPKNKILLSTAARAGNTILVTKTCAISAAAILALSFPSTVKNKAGAEIYHQACDSFYQTSSLQDALIAVEYNNEYTGVTAMHDVTEGGVLGAIYELAFASGNGAIIYHDQLPLSEVQEAVCNIFDIDPGYCVGAGAMIITCEKQSSQPIIARLAEAGIACAVVGELCDKQNGITLHEQDKISELKYTGEDPYWAAFFKALNIGWT